MRHTPLRVVVLNWRDTTHPEGGGSERFVERVAADLVAAGCEVTLICARHPGAAPDAPRRMPPVRRDGVVIRFRGGRYGVYPAALGALLALRLRGQGPDVVLDVQNGVPFFARLVAGCPVVVLVHHVHREQWRVVFGTGRAALGWFVESRLAPRVHAGCQYVTVSRATRRELVALGVRPGDVAVVHNGSPGRPVPGRHPRDPTPTLAVLGRLVPHKRVEHAVQAVAALRGEFAGLRLLVIGDGWWRAELERTAARLGVAGVVTFTGRVDEATKSRLLARSWLLLAPSVKEGWGLMVVEAGAHGVPAVAYRGAGGVRESIDDGRTGVLVDDLPGLVEATRRLLRDRPERERLGAAARDHAARHDWTAASASMHLLLARAAAGMPPCDAADPGTGSALRVLDASAVTAAGDHRLP